jgi:hypothetical protein
MKKTKRGRVSTVKRGPKPKPKGEIKRQVSLYISENEIERYGGIDAIKMRLIINLEK